MPRIRSSGPKATIQPVREVGQHQADTLKAMASIDIFRKSMPRLSIEEIQSARHEGHKY